MRAFREKRPARAGATLLDERSEKDMMEPMILMDGGKGNKQQLDRRPYPNIALIEEQWPGHHAKFTFYKLLIHFAL